MEASSCNASFKKGNKYDIKNYWPIALLSLVGKCYEKIVCRQLSDFLELNTCLSNLQHGFRRKRSCETALLRLSNLLFSAKQNKKYSCLITIDFSRAFDCINFDLIIVALRECGISELACKWFMSYLSNRTQCTKYYGAVLDALHIISGVPQGSILGPILFNVYLNRLLKLLPNKYAVAYADDLTLVCSDDALQTAHQRMQSLLDLISIWAKNNQLCINISKCYTMSIAASARKSTTCLASKLYLSNHQISIVSDIKVLGVSFTRDFKWQLHQSSVRRKLSNMTSVVARFGRSLNIKARKNIVQAFVLPHLTYCLPVWGSTSSGCMSSMDRVLERITRVILHNKNATLNSTSALTSGVCTFKRTLFYRNVCCIFSFMKANTLPYYTNVDMPSSNSSFNTRSSVCNKLKCF